MQRSGGVTGSRASFKNLSPKGGEGSTPSLTTSNNPFEKLTEAFTRMTVLAQDDMLVFGEMIVEVSADGRSIRLLDERERYYIGTDGRMVEDALDKGRDSVLISSNEKIKVSPGKTKVCRGK